MMTNNEHARQVGDNKPVRGFQYLLLAAAIVTFLLIAVGTVVRLSGAEQACPDWPACNGVFTIPDGDQARIQYAHRALAGLAMVLTIAAAVLAWKKRREQRLVFLPLVGASGLVVAEAAAGAWQALNPVSPAWMGGLHMGLALGSMGLLVFAGVAAFWARLDPARRLSLRFQTPFARLALVSLVITFIVIVSGIILARLSPGNVCAGWPL